jgi:GNAT superfamily N-acetyltransferase
MIYQLEANDYDSVRPVCARIAEMHLDVTAVLDGGYRGRVYTDDIAHPHVACVISGDGYYLAGEPGHASYNRALNAILPRDTYFALFCDLERWQDVLGDVLRGTYAVLARRRYYRLGAVEIPEWEARVPPGFSVRRFDRDLLADGLAGSDDVAEGILENWTSLESFLTRGFGFCVVHGNDIVSHCLTDYVDGTRCEIGVQTSWGYRRRGLGTLAAAATVADAVERGYSQVGWHCWDNNVGSIGVAENVGFEQVQGYQVYLSHWAAENVTDMTTDEFRAFAERYERWFAVEPPISGFPHIVAAKAWALCGEHAACFRQLGKAVEVGWLKSAEHLADIWPEFFAIQHLDDRPEWRALMQRARWQ